MKLRGIPASIGLLFPHQAWKTGSARPASASWRCSFSLARDANVYLVRCRWGVFAVAAPVIGGVIIFLVSNFAHKVEGHGAAMVSFSKEGLIRIIARL